MYDPIFSTKFSVSSVTRASLQAPQFVGRRVCTFHNQRDFIFFRQHRYIFKEDGKGVRLQELGPRFTLKLKWVMAGVFDPQFGKYEWYHKRHEMETSKRKFAL
jgi:ribosome production factor 1